jgi:thiamine biosynthesis protein ThiS
MSKIKILLNGEETLIDENISINKLINNLNLDLSKIAIERNLEIINYDDFEKVILKENDRIEIVAFVGGG